MSVLLLMFRRKTSEDTAVVTSSRESASGTMPLALPGGRKMQKSGRAPVPASPSARPAKVKRSTIRGTFGRRLVSLSRHDDLSFALASKLHPLTDSLGSTLYRLTWTRRCTPAGRWICALRASKPLTEDSVCIGWPTPTGEDHKSDGPTVMDRLRDGDWRTCDQRLRNLATLAGWPTPQSSDMTGGGQAKRADGRANLNDFSMLAAWNSPRANDAEKRGKVAEDLRNGLVNDAVLAGGATPAARDYRHANAKPYSERGGGAKGEQLQNQAKLLCSWPANPDALDVARILNLEPQLQALVDSGVTQVGFLLDRNGWEIVPASGQLNPAHSRWLMGLPPVWDACAVTAMELSRLRRRRS